MVIEMVQADVIAIAIVVPAKVSSRNVFRVKLNFSCY